MTPIPQNPTVVVLVNENREVVAVSNNIAPDLKVVTVRNLTRFEEESSNKPFVEAGWAELDS